MRGTKTIQMGFVMEKLTAFVAVDKDGDEGVMAFLDPGFGSWTPMIAADPTRAKLLYPMAVDMAQKGGITLKVLQFDNRVDVTEEWKKTDKNIN